VDENNMPKGWTFTRLGEVQRMSIEPKIGDINERY